MIGCIIRRDYVSAQYFSCLPKEVLQQGNAPGRRGEKVASTEPSVQGSSVKQRGTHSPPADFAAEEPVAPTLSVSQAHGAGDAEGESAFGDCADDIAAWGSAAKSQPEGPSS